MSLRSLLPKRECVPGLKAATMAPQALVDVAAVLERPLVAPLLHLGIIKQTSPFSSFYSLTAVDLDGEAVDFGEYRNKARRFGVCCARRASHRALTAPARPGRLRQVVLALNVPTAGDWGAEETYKVRSGQRVTVNRGLRLDSP